MPAAMLFVVLMQRPGHLLWCLTGEAHRKQKRDQHLPNENEAPRWCLFSSVIFENTRGPGPPQSASTLRRGDSASPSAATTYPAPSLGKTTCLKARSCRIILRFTRRVSWSFSLKIAAVWVYHSFPREPNFQARIIPALSTDNTCSCPWW